MKVATTVNLSEDVRQVLDQQASTLQARSEIVETALRTFFQQQLTSEQNQQDLAIINEHADALNEEAADVLSYQADW